MGSFTLHREIFKLSLVLWRCVCLAQKLVRARRAAAPRADPMREIAPLNFYFVWSAAATTTSELVPNLQANDISFANLASRLASVRSTSLVTVTVAFFVESNVVVYVQPVVLRQPAAVSTAVLAVNVVQVVPHGVEAVHVAVVAKVVEASGAAALARVLKATLVLAVVVPLTAA